MTSLDFNDLTSDLSFTKAKTGADRTVTFLPEPTRAERKYTVISVDDHIVEPPNFEEMRRGSWDIHARIADMDLNGVWGSLNFPSFLPGFAGQRLQMTTNDRDLAMATTRAWNDWHLDAWCGAAPERLIPCQVPWMLDAEVGAQMVRENAERGFRAVTFPEGPHGHGL